MSPILFYFLLHVHDRSQFTIPVHGREIFKDKLMERNAQTTAYKGETT